jgi:hypothetical protein
VTTSDVTADEIIVGLGRIIQAPPGIQEFFGITEGFAVYAQQFLANITKGNTYR